MSLLIMNNYTSHYTNTFKNVKYYTYIYLIFYITHKNADFIGQRLAILQYIRV